jgi:hypothetical protein
VSRVSLSGPRHTLPSRSMVEAGEPATSREPDPKAVLSRIVPLACVSKRAMSPELARHKATNQHVYALRW